MANISTIHIKTDFDCIVYDYGQELGTTKADTFCNFELRKGEHELTFVYSQDESISKAITYEVKDADCDYRLIIELAEIICDKAIELYDSENYSCAFTLYSLAAEKDLAKAQNGLGECYYFGNGVEKDRAKAVELYAKAAEQGYARAQCNFGMCYTYGNGVESDFAKATEWLTKAADQGDIKAQKTLVANFLRGRKGYKAQLMEWFTKAAEQGIAIAQSCLGSCYENGECGIEKDQTKAVEWYTKAAEQGHAGAQNKLGDCYALGKGVEKDISKAAKWYTKAAEQGHAEAQCNIGFYYENGTGVKKDLSIASEWLTKAHEHGINAAYIGRCYENGTYGEKNLSKAEEWYTKAAERGDSYVLGLFYYREKNYSKAVEWFTKAAKQGYAEAQNKLGLCFQYGNGVEKDLLKAVEWFTKAAEKGDADAQCKLGACYFVGYGIEKDLTKAVEWFTRAAEQGHAGAQCNLGFCYRYGNGVEKDFVKAVEWYTKAAEQGNDMAQCNLGYCYEIGKGVDKDLTKAVEWYTKAAEQGLARAQFNLGSCYEHNRGIEKDLLKAVEWYTKAVEQEGSPDKDSESEQIHKAAKDALDRIKTIQEKPIHYLFFDTETTGIPSDYHAPTSNLSNWPRLVQLSWITTDKDCNIIAQNNFIIYPEGFVIPSDAVRLHGITTDIAKEQGEPLDVVIDKFMKDFNAATTIIGHNIAFDKKIIGAELIRLGQKDIMNSKRALCTMEIGTNYCKIPGYHGYKWPRLQELHKKLFGYEFEDAHNSMSDVTVTLKCFKEMRKRGLI